ncbi:DNA polymerase III subunit delta' [Lacticaseibacillus pabuli]|uniref:DNA polymerase III subunit delta n=1 Tax=Lacticaseibacillus pabuli TaxID=3025672 RepID=A0ABY7WW36_9LACO|nr:DNA polymerase III subunit delta' [Lacticaseibacillus sp. KACC 23028]WDF83345.1 DNA polymerase III subunit delta' [Lacticaseibacillus sp. KACC 23028]
MASATQLQPGLTAQFKQIIAQNRLSQAMVFVGQKGSGKMALAQWIAQRLFCTDLQDGAPCGKCAECRRIAEGNNPDVLTVAPEGQSIKAEAVRNLKAEMGKSSVEGHQRVFIIQDADRMTASAANSLLKFFEEPYPGMVIILTVTNKSQLLPTVLSRAQIIQFPAPSVPATAKVLAERGVATNIAGLLATLSRDVEGDVAVAQDAEFTARLQATLQLLQLLANGDPLAFTYIQTDLMKEIPGRPEQKQVLSILAAAYSEALSRSYGQAPELLPHDAAVAKLAGANSLSLADGLAAVLRAQQLLESNVNFQAACEQLVLILQGATPAADFS